MNIKKESKEMDDSRLRCFPSYSSEEQEAGFLYCSSTTLLQLSLSFFPDFLSHLPILLSVVCKRSFWFKNVTPVFSWRETKDQNWLLNLTQSYCMTFGTFFFFLRQIKHKMMNDGWRQVTRFFILQLLFHLKLAVSLTTKMKVKDGACIDSATRRTSWCSSISKRD